MNSQNNNNDNNFNVILAMVLIFAILWGWGYIKDKPTPHSHTEQIETKQKKQNIDHKKIYPSNTPPLQTKILNQYLHIKSSSIKGKINLQGGRIDDISLLKYTKNADGTGGNIKILTSENLDNAYFVDFQWKSMASNIRTPDSNTIWNSNSNTLTPESPVILTWNNGQGLNFTRTISIDNKYLITVTDSVENSSQQNISLFSHSTISRNQLTEVSSFFILHEGPIGYLSNKLVEIKYEDLNSKHKNYNSTGGWLGVTDKYWLTAIIPEQNKHVKASYGQYFNGKNNVYLTDCMSPEINIKANGGKTSYTQHLFVGPKVLKTLDDYEIKLGVEHFDLAVDFGWFYFLTKPIFNILTMAKDYLGNFGLGILLLTVILKLLFFPLANKSYRSMAKMKKLQPKMVKLRELYKGDKMRLNQEIMSLYKKEKVNPMAGCLPMIVQIPVFFALYKVLFVSIEMRHAPFFGWVTDLSAPDSTTIFNLFGLIPWDPPSMLQIGALPIFMGITMIIQQRLNPAPADPVQEKMFLIMPIVFTVMLSSFPSGLVIYWAWNNILTIMQQWTIMRLSEK